VYLTLTRAPQCTVVATERRGTLADAAKTFFDHQVDV
jgi:hypothetical protein